MCRQIEVTAIDACVGVGAGVIDGGGVAVRSVGKGLGEGEGERLGTAATPKPLAAVSNTANASRRSAKSQPARANVAARRGLTAS